MKVIVGKTEYLAHLKFCRAHVQTSGLYMVCQKDGALFASNEAPIRNVVKSGAPWEPRKGATWVHVTTLAPYGSWHTLVMTEKSFEGIEAKATSTTVMENVEESTSMHDICAGDQSKFDLYLAKSYTNKFSNSVERKLKFDLTLEFWQNLHKEGQLCPITNKPMIVRKMSEGVFPDDTLSIERLNPRRGYVMGNVVAMSHVANSAKSSVDMLIHNKKLDDESKVRILRKALYQLEKEIKERGKASTAAPSCGESGDV